MDWWMLSRILKDLGGACLAGAVIYGIVRAVTSKARQRHKALEEKQRHDRETLDRMKDASSSHGTFQRLALAGAVRRVRLPSK